MGRCRSIALLMLRPSNSCKLPLHWQSEEPSQEFLPKRRFAVGTSTGIAPFPRLRQCPDIHTLCPHPETIRNSICLTSCSGDASGNPALPRKIVGPPPSGLHGDNISLTQCQALASHLGNFRHVGREQQSTGTLISHSCFPVRNTSEPPVPTEIFS